MSFLLTPRFLPLFKTQFLGACNDNMLKNALVMLLTYRIASQAAYNVQILVVIAGGLFILPSLLLSAPAGQLADKYDKAWLTRIIKVCEIAIMTISTIGFLTENVLVLMIALTCMGIHSTFFSPIKLALLPQHLNKDELLSGNAYIEGGTFLAILLGTLIGGQLILLPAGSYVVSLALIVIAVSGYVTSRKIPVAPAPDPNLSVNWNIVQETFRLIKYARNDRDVFLAIIGISWFWFIGATLLAEIAPFVKNSLHAQAGVVTLLLAVFSVGIGAGALLSNKLLRGHIQVTYVPLAVLAISAFTIDLFFATHNNLESASALNSVWQYMRTFDCWRVAFDFFMVSVAGGVFVVPLNAHIQHYANPAHLARIIAANNIMNSVFIIGSALATMMLLAIQFTIPDIFLILGLANLLAAIYICQLLPDALIRSILRVVLSTLYRVEIKGMEHFVKAGDRVLIVANHTSFLDAVLIAAYMPEKLNFAVNSVVAKKWWMRPVLHLVNALSLDPTNPLATKTLIDLIRQDKKCMIFPEGRITLTGSLMKIYEGPGMIADKSGANLLPIRIDGAQFTPFSRLKGKIRLRWFPKITLTILPPVKFEIDEAIKGRRRRQVASAQLYDIMSEMMFLSTNYNQTLFASLIAAKEIHGRGQIVAEDIERKPLTYGSFIARSFILGRALTKTFEKQPVMAILLPNSVATAITFFALQAYGRTPAMLNFAAGSTQIIAACQMAQVTTVVTSRRFVKLSKLDAVITSLEAAGIALCYFEDLTSKIGRVSKVLGLVASFYPSTAYTLTGKGASPEAPAVILYTSGSEGTPKAVALSHVNIRSNCAQLASRIDFGPSDKVLNVLPMFHSFGLTGGTLLPILAGIKTFYYPSPLHYRIVPELIYDTNSTIMFGTDTFLSAYARFANPYDMNSIRYIFAGAEKLKEETRRVYADKFGVRVLEGYGATETSPAISMNTPIQNRAGTVGRLLPGIEYRLDQVPGITEGGQFFVKGPNIMLGYLRSDAPGQIQPPADGWYDTGDIVDVDAEGYIAIKGRTKRFAKIGGEMVSLAAVEEAVAKLWPDFKHAAISVPDTKKGEQIVLLTDFAGANRDEIVRYFRSQSITELSLPKRILTIASMPMLGTGKTDYQKAKAAALETAA